jgi:hypothetical protein
MTASCRNKRKLRGKDHDPATPDITQKMSKRSWDGIVSGCQVKGIPDLLDFLLQQLLCMCAVRHTSLQQRAAVLCDVACPCSTAQSCG